ncbi:MAG: cobaltochelatase subunit CobN, partial [Candidatus Methanomethylophilaceae archaeon]|nr:cobaltochelatase subunit CobN [Candidatus Methanomethylophilaceae archaeon]
AAKDAGLDISRMNTDELRRYEREIINISDSIDRSDELGSFIHALDGGYTEAGPSGVITRGRADILPTGRNFYSADPKKLPNRSSWRVGVLLAENTVKKYLEDTGELPETVAFFWMSGDLLASGGEQMAQILYMMGAAPVWSSDGQVNDVRIVPLKELGRPRIDITVRTSGILRDNFIHCIDLIDTAVRRIAELDESSEENFVRKHVLESCGKGTAYESSTARLFSAPPGSYVSGVNLAVYASAWKTEKDLAEIYIASNGYAYGNGRNGAESHEQFAYSLSKVSVTYNKIASDEKDLLGCCCYFSNHGGMTAASRYLSGKDVKAYYGDTREPDDINVHTLADEIRRVVRTKLLNPKWIDGMKEHGYKGGADMMKRIVRVYGFEATTNEVDDWIFDDIASTFVNDEEMREFYKENNPYALEEIARRLLEAEARGLWNADRETLEQLKENYMSIESWMEDLVTEGEHQGGNIDIVSPEDVKEWNGHMAPIISKVNSFLNQ